MATPELPDRGESCLIIDSSFVFLGPMYFMPLAPRLGRVEVETWAGGISSNTKYWKEVFDLELGVMSLNEMKALTQLLQTTGTSATHTVRNQTPGLTMLWDSATAAGSNINTDINRVRKKVLITYDGFTPIPGWANLYHTVLHCKEI